MKPLKYYQGYVHEIIQEDKERNNIFAEVTDLWNSYWELPAELAAVPGMIPFKTTKAHDAVFSAIRAMATIMPTLEIQPRMPSVDELKVIEELEQLLSWEYQLANRRSSNYPLWDIMKSILLYGTVAVQTQYLPFELKEKKGKRVEMMKRRGNFVFRVETDPSTIHATTSNELLESIFLAKTVTARSIINKYGEDNTGVKALLKKIGDDAEAPDKTKCSIFDLTNYDERVIWITIGDTLSEGGSDAIEIQRLENKMPFINWVYRTDEDYLLKPVVDAGLVNKRNIIGSLNYYTMLATINQNTLKVSQTQSGDAPEVNYTPNDIGGIIPLRVGEGITGFPPRMLDPLIMTIAQSLDADINTSTVAKILQSTEGMESVPFSSLNAMMSTALSSLSKWQKIGELIHEELFSQMIDWVNYSDIGLSGYRSNNSKYGSEPSMMKGAGISLEPNAFAPEQLYLTVKLQPDNPNDRQQRLQEGILVHKELEVPLMDVYERVGYPNAETMKLKYIDEVIDRAKTQAITQTILGEADMALREKIRAQVMKEMEQQQQGGEQGGEQGGQGQESAPNPDTAMQEMNTGMVPGGEMNNPAGGGMPPSMTAPEQTSFEGATGMTRSGEEVVA